MLRKLICGTLVLSLGLIIPTACKRKADEDYLKSIDEWHQKRIEGLKAPDSWLSLAGLFWLKDGENRFGTDPSNDVVFPEDNAPAEMGVFILDNGRVTVKVNEGVEIRHDKEPVTTLEMKSDMTGDPTFLNYGTLSWFVIQRGDQIGIRLRDSANPKIAGFQGIERFPVSEKWRIEARFEPYDSVKTIAVPTVLGTISESPCSGALVFDIDGREYSLDPIAEEGGNGYFIIFGDDTNGTETYGAGRFLSASAAGPDGKVILDFNKAYNPPCAFSPYATCPLPPEQNILPLAVKAGEKAYAGGHH
jgi:uncharacterized protein (DUF1684 family)